MSEQENEPHNVTDVSTLEPPSFLATLWATMYQLNNPFIIGMRRERPISAIIIYILVIWIAITILRVCYTMITDHSAFVSRQDFWKLFPNWMQSMYSTWTAALLIIYFVISHTAKWLGSFLLEIGKKGHDTERFVFDESNYAFYGKPRFEKFGIIFGIILFPIKYGLLIYIIYVNRDFILFPFFSDIDFPVWKHFE